MWVTGFATVEDINEIRVKTRAPKPQLMATYYQRLTQLFQVSGNHLFHAFAFGEFVRVSETHQRNLSDDLKNANATKLLLATLAIPAFQARTSDMEFNLESQRLKNLAALLGFRETPDRESQLRQLLERDILNRVSESTQKLYRILNTFDPLGIVAKAKPILVELEQDDALKDYVKPLRELIVIRLLEQLSKVYHRVKVDKFRATVEDLGMDFPSVEKLLVRAVRARNLSVKLDHQSGSLRFNHEDVGSMDGTKDHLNDLAGRLSRVVDVVEPGRAAAAAERAVAIRAALAKETLASLATDNADALQRKVIIEQQKERAERDQAERDRVEEQQRLLDEELRQEQERIRQEKEKKKREQEKKERILREIKIKETQATMKRLGMAADKTEDMESVNQDELRKKIREKAMNAHKNQLQRMREQQRRLDFLTRAIRENEVPKLQARFEEQKVADAEHFTTQQAEKKVRRRRRMSCVGGGGGHSGPLREPLRVCTRCLSSWLWRVWRMVVAVCGGPPLASASRFRAPRFRLSLPPLASASRFRLSLPPLPSPSPFLRRFALLAFAPALASFPDPVVSTSFRPPITMSGQVPPVASCHGNAWNPPVTEMGQ
jgi:translation initiation factor 3 subunit A